MSNKSLVSFQNCVKEMLGLADNNRPTSTVLLLWIFHGFCTSLNIIQPVKEQGPLLSPIPKEFMSGDNINIRQIYSNRKTPFGRNNLIWHTEEQKSICQNVIIQVAMKGWKRCVLFIICKLQLWNTECKKKNQEIKLYDFKRLYHCVENKYLAIMNK